MNQYFTAYVKGGEKERFNPLTGCKYDRLQTHDLNDVEEQVQGQSNLLQPRDAYLPKRGRSNFFKKGDEQSRWKGKSRSNSPYHKANKDAQPKPAETQKSKDKA